MVSYSRLPYDVLYEICLTAQTSRIDEQEWKEREDKDQFSPCSLINLSVVDRRTRDVAICVMFRSGTIRLKNSWLKTTEEEVNGLIDTIMENERILRMVKYVYISHLSSRFRSSVDTDALLSRMLLQALMLA
jgi:hypothetical protein